MTKELNGKLSPELLNGIRALAECGNANFIPEIDEIDGKTATYALLYMYTATACNVRENWTLQALTILQDKNCQLEITGHDKTWTATDKNTGTKATGFSMSDAIRKLAEMIVAATVTPTSTT